MEPWSTVGSLRLRVLRFALGLGHVAGDEILLTGPRQVQRDSLPPLRPVTNKELILLAPRGIDMTVCDLEVKSTRNRYRELMIIRSASSKGYIGSNLVLSPGQYAPTVSRGSPLLSLDVPATRRGKLDRLPEQTVLG